MVTGTGTGKRSVTPRGRRGVPEPVTLLLTGVLMALRMLLPGGDRHRDR